MQRRLRSVESGRLFRGIWGLDMPGLLECAPMSTGTKETTRRPQNIDPDVWRQMLLIKKAANEWKDTFHPNTTLERLSAITGISTSTIGAMLRGKLSPNAYTITPFCKAVGIEEPAFRAGRLEVDPSYIREKSVFEKLEDLLGSEDRDHVKKLIDMYWKEHFAQSADHPQEPQPPFPPRLMEHDKRS